MIIFNCFSCKHRIQYEEPKLIVDTEGHNYCDECRAGHVNVVRINLYPLLNKGG